MTSTPWLPVLGALSHITSVGLTLSSLYVRTLDKETFGPCFVDIPSLYPSVGVECGSFVKNREKTLRSVQTTLFTYICNSNYFLLLFAMETLVNCKGPFGSGAGHVVLLQPC